MELTLALFTVIAIMALLCEYMDASIGMGCRESLEHQREEREIETLVIMSSLAIVAEKEWTEDVLR